MLATPQSTREQIVLTAERLFAQHGIDGVSLRRIGTAAGNANNSAVQYHFGSKEQLVRAIFAHRLPRLHQYRTGLIAERQPDDLRAWVECQLRTVMDQSEQPDSYYLGFLSMLYQYGRRDIFEQLPEDLRASTWEFHRRLDGLLPDLPEPLRSHRVAQATSFIIHEAADRERALRAGRSVLPFIVAVAELTDGLVGFLRASASPEALAALHDATASESAPWPPFL